MRHINYQIGLYMNTFIWLLFSLSPSYILPSPPFLESIVNCNSDCCVFYFLTFWRFGILAGILPLNLQIFGSFSTCFNPHAWKSQLVAKAHALWISQVLTINHFFVKITALLPNGSDIWLILWRDILFHGIYYRAMSIIFFALGLDSN